MTPESIKGLDVVTTLTRRCHNHWFLADKKILSEKQLQIFCKIALAVELVKNFLGYDEPKQKDYDEDCVIDYQSDIKKHVDDSCAIILDYFYKVENKKR